MENAKTSTVAEILKGTLISVVVSLILVLIFAVIAKFCTLKTEIFPFVNEAIKAISIFVGVLFAVKEPSKGFWKGMLIGMLFTVVSAGIFALLGGTFSGTGILLDLVIGTVVGIIAGIVAVNRKNNRRNG